MDNESRDNEVDDWQLSNELNVKEADEDSADKIIRDSVINIELNEY